MRAREGRAVTHAEHEAEPTRVAARRGDVEVEDVRGEVELDRLLAHAESDVESKTVMELVRDSTCTAYDCEFVALAMMLDVKLVTMDQKLLKAFPKRAVALQIA